MTNPFGRALSLAYDVANRVNTIAVPLYASRGLHLTAVLYAVFWINAWVALWHWRRLMQADARPAAAGGGGG